MTGIPQFNFPAFESAARNLRMMGYSVISPHETDTPEVQKAAWASPDGALHNGRIADRTWGDILAEDVKIVADVVDGVVFLPNWTSSRGAKLEALTGLLTNKKFYEYKEDGDGVYLNVLPAGTVANELRRAI